MSYNTLLMEYSGATCAWYRSFSQGKLLLEQQIGLSEQFINRFGELSVGESAAALWSAWSTNHATGSISPI